VLQLLLPLILILQPPDGTTGNSTDTYSVRLLLLLRPHFQNQVQEGSPACPSALCTSQMPSTGYILSRHTQVPTFLLGGLHSRQRIEYIRYPLYKHHHLDSCILRHPEHYSNHEENIGTFGILRFVNVGVEGAAGV